jgi:methionine aminotransferase
VFDGAKHATALANAELAARTFAVFSFGKTYHATGWKLGYCVAPATLSAEFRRVHQYVTFSSTSPLQQALAEYIVAQPEHHLGLPDFYQERRDYFAQILAATKFRALKVPGTYFQLADYSAISSVSDVEFARWLTIEHGVATIPVSVFYEQPPDIKLVRFCFAKENMTLDAAAARLQAL